MHEPDMEKVLAGVDPNDIGREFDAEELELIRTLQGLRAMRGPATFVRSDPFARDRKFARGDRRTDREGKKVGPTYRDAIVFQDEENTVVDLDATRFERARQYLARRRLPAGRASNLKKLGRAARILTAG